MTAPKRAKKSIGQTNWVGPIHSAEFLDYKKMIHTGVRLGTIESRIYEVQQMIVDCVSNQCADQPDNCQEMVKEAKAQLRVRLLITMAKYIVENRILYQIYNNPLQKARLCKWWYRFRYSVAGSAIKFADTGTSSQIRLDILQYYLDTQSKLKALIAQFDSKHAYLATVLSTLDSNSAFKTFECTQLMQSKPSLFHQMNYQQAWLKHLKFAKL
ncbi:hypothetical protein niasHT_002940 [Heterodera trifolii]|uniref:Uncharacterized protein n=1 Tax=Heterodera trifolii TaxID=157864 RepID=A0ABD2LPD6_9BILA